jgi:cytochrome b561
MEMGLSNTYARYGSVAMALHWIIAAALIANLCLGLYAGNLPHDDPGLPPILQIHKSIGLTVLILSLARLGWRLANPVPPLPTSMGRLLKFAAHATHFLLYFLIIAIPLAGWAMVSSSAHGMPIMYFGLFEWPHIPLLADFARTQHLPLRHDFGLMHTYLAWSAIALIPIHVIGALFHQFRGDDVLRRMLPGTRISGIG